VPGFFSGASFLGALRSSLFGGAVKKHPAIGIYLQASPDVHCPLLLESPDGYLEITSSRQ
jgi:hypothetical protein